ncbi:MAG: ATP-binding protein [Ignavibacteria bacterium]
MSFSSYKYKFLTGVIIFLVLWLVVLRLIYHFISVRIIDDWEDIYNKKTQERTYLIQSNFQKLTEHLSSLTKSISNNLDVKKNLENGEIHKLFQTILKTETEEAFSVEVYNKWFNLIAYKGNSLESEYTLFLKSMGGKESLVFRDVGFGQYMLLYTPIRSQRDSSIIVGVLVTGVLLDSKYLREKKLSIVNCFARELETSLRTSVEILSSQKKLDSSRYEQSQIVSCQDKDGHIIGYVQLPSYTQKTHMESVETFFAKANATVVLLGSFLLLYFLLNFASLWHNIGLRLLTFGITLVLIRYLWLFFDVPAVFWDSGIFSAVYFASPIGGGIAKSLGELLITLCFGLLFSLYCVYQSFRELKDSTKRSYGLLSLLHAITYVILFALVYWLFELVLRTIVVNSNVKFLDRVNFIPSADLLIVQLIFIALVFTVVYLEVAIQFALFYIVKSISGGKLFKKYYGVIILITLLVVTEILQFFLLHLDSNFIERLGFVILIFIFAYYLDRSILHKKSNSIFSLRSLSLSFLIGLVVTPVLILDTSKSQEAKYVELIGTHLASQNKEAIVFLIANELDRLTNNNQIFSSFKNKDEIKKLAFYLWKESKLSSENYNSAVFILDGKFKSESEFNVSPSTINLDSVISFAKRNYFEKELSYSSPDYLISDSSSASDTLLGTESEIEESQVPEVLPMLYEDISVLRDARNKYYIAIKSIEDPYLKGISRNSQLGYIVFVVHSEYKTLLPSTTFQFFGDFTVERLIDKLTVKPVITEFLNGEVINSTDPEISKSIAKNLDAFRQRLLRKEGTKYWRYENINNKSYRTFYILAEPLNYENYGENPESVERIFTVSIIYNDLASMMFFYFKFILFATFVFLIVFAIKGLFLLKELKTFRLNFRDRLFAAFLVVSIIPIIILAIYTRSYITNKNDNFFRNQIVSDLNLGTGSLQDAQKLISRYKSIDSLQKFVTGIFIKNFSRTDKSYILYLKNRMVATTNKELFDAGLLDPRADAEAFYNIYYLKRDLFIRYVNIGEYSFLVGYKPFYSVDNTIAGILSSLSVYKQTEINSELTETLTYIFGSYVIMIIFLLWVVSLVTERMYKPLLELKTAVEMMSRGNTSIQIPMKRRDEFGELIESFNRMTTEIEKSKIELKRAEREATWRDVARRVAHEIRNPLTPMKLAIQHLYNQYKNRKSEDFTEILLRTKNLIVNEIDKLDYIATEFSNFAKMPQRNYEALSINNILDEVIALYATNQNIRFEKKLQSAALILADRQELNRAFQNIIKNAVQAIIEEGVIKVRTYDFQNSVICEIEDNGCGIDEEIIDRLFEPNFSTKSKGMGLGLAITKKTLDDMKASIKIQSEKNKGTLVRIQFKTIENSKSEQ